VPDLESAEEDLAEIQPSEREQLGAHFYTRTTGLQEELLRRPAEGLVVVLGVAGSGKTSVALGRTKFLCDVLEEDGADRFFYPETAMGYVLSEQLSSYLQAASKQLMLNLPIKEYRQLRQELASRRDIAAAGMSGLGDAAPGLDGAMTWLRAADIVVAEAIVEGVKAAMAAPPPTRDLRGETGEQREERTRALAGVWRVLAQRVDSALAPLGSSSSSTSFRLEGLVRRLDQARARFAEDLEGNAEWKGPERRELRQNVRSLVRERLVRTLRLPNVYRDVVQGARFEAELRTAGPDEVAVDDELQRVRERLTRGLASPDVDVLLALYQLVAAGYMGRDGRDPISHLVDSDHHSQVFIDEFQDFSEVQLFLMGRQSDPERHAVTVVGDLLQRLHIGREPRVEHCFPWASSADVVPAVLLENKRQVRALASFSHAVRRTLLADKSLDVGQATDEPGELPRMIETAVLATAVAAEIAELPRNFSIAVLAASEESAASIESAIREELTSAFRESRVSRQAELLKRFYVHFTTPTEAKGLEFDAVIIAGAEAFQFEDPVSAHSFYVACSRPRKRLSVVATKLDARLRDLADRGLATVVL
jgi:hypothetical protein